MNEEDRIRKLAQRARLEAPPQVDIAGGVMAALRTMPGNGRTVADPLAWIAAASAAAAIAVLVATFSFGESWTDPFMASRIDLPWWLL